MERVLVCLLASTRGHELSWPSFKRQVLEELDADLALAVTLDEKYDDENPYWQQAKFRWTAVEQEDTGDSYDEAQRVLWGRPDIPPPDWRSMLRIRGHWLGGIQAENPQPSRSAQLFFCRWLLLHGLQQDGVLDRYDRFVVTRSDFLWLSPHPPLSVLDPGALWIPDGQQFGGLTDRHLVVSREDLTAALGLIDDILLRPYELYEEMKHRDDWNPERYLALHLARKGLLRKVRLFPYIMYLARDPSDTSPTWSPGRFEPSLGYFIKYEGEFRDARANAAVIKTREDWEKGAWKPAHRRRIYAPVRPALGPVSRVFAALWRPGRVARIGRFARRTLGRVTNPQVSNRD